MKKLIYPLMSICALTLLLWGYSFQGDPNSEMAPVTTQLTFGNNSTPDTTPPGNFPYPVKFTFNYSAIPGVSGGTVGAFYHDGKYFFNRWNNSTLYRFNADGPGGGPGTLADSNTNYAGQIRDLTTDGNFLFGGRAASTLYRMDFNGNTITTKNIPGAQFRAIAWDPNRKGFWNTNFSGNITCYDTNGTLLGAIPSTLSGKYGLAFDSTSSSDSAFLWVWNQETSQTENSLNKYHIASGTLVTTYMFTLPPPSGTGIAGGAEAVQIGNQFVLLLNYQNFALGGYILKESGPPPPVGGNTLVLFHDTTVVSSQAKRLADKDSLMRYLPELVGNYTFQTFDATTVLTGLDQYNTIMLFETSFDATQCRYLGATARDSIKAWLNAGTSGNKRAFLNMGADQGYNYGRSGSAAYDQVLTETLLKYVYKADNSNVTGQNAITGSTIDIGNDRMMTTSPAGGGFWPDGCTLQSGGVDTYKYKGRVSSTDSLASIGINASGYVGISIFQDPRYFINGDLKAVLSAAIKYLTDNGGMITNIGGNGSEITADQYSLSQNYPNPFNPVTKINFSIPQSGFVSMKVYDIMGREIATLVNEVKNAGTFTVEFNGANLSSGTYFVRMQAGDFSQVRRMVLVK
ncbi:MAG: T9SS type A sorting domain-containing protein [Ignavibacteria bacterium]|nr:hypothetical protein [Ignavibacteria bacterium]